MPLQNRVDPQGNIIRTSARGAWLGNRGVIHNPQQEIVRPFKLKAWIICELEFRGRHREVMMPDRWTELFFLDEATAFSAGHRPCFQCRYTAHQHSKSAWLKGNPEYGFTDKTSIQEIDKILHRERIDRKAGKVTYTALAKNLPYGTFILIDDQPHLLNGEMMYPWSPSGYGDAVAVPDGDVTGLTPRSIVNAFEAGYVPQMGIL